MSKKLWIIVLAGMLICTIGSDAQRSAFQVNYDAINKFVVFIYARDANGKTQPDGTGFVLSIPLKSNPSRTYAILVTARHMIDQSWTGCPVPVQLVARFNKKIVPGVDPASAGTVDYDLPTYSATYSTPRWQNWVVPVDDSADVAFTVLNLGKLGAIGADVSPVGLDNLATLDETKLMGTGSQIMSAGLIPAFSDFRRNYPVFKFGYVSSRPDERLTLKDCPNGISRQETAWIIAASLVPGNSGSPILYVPVAFNGISFGNYGRPSIIGIQSSAIVGWDVAGMTPIQFLIDSIKSADIPDADLSALDRGANKPIDH